MDKAIRPFKVTDTEIISPMFPADWHFDFAAFVALNMDKPYFKGFTLVADKQPVGYGNLVIFGKSAWLGNIVVDEKYRNNGWGKQITNYLIDYARSNSVVTYNLIATELGGYVYTKLGFEPEMMYIFFKPTDKTKQLEYSYETTKADIKDLEQIAKLDFVVTGECRKELLANYLEHTLLLLNSKGKLEGFFVETMGNGLIIANDEAIGTELLKQIINSKRNAVVPEANKAAIDLLLASGYEKTNELPRMVMGKKIVWYPEKIFNRGTGYAG